MIKMHDDINKNNNATDVGTSDISKKEEIKAAEDIAKRFSAVWIDKKGNAEDLDLSHRLIQCNDSIKFFGDLYTAYAYAVDMLKGMKDTEAFIHDYIRVFCPEARNNKYGEEYTK